MQYIHLPKNLAEPRLGTTDLDKSIPDHNPIHSSVESSLNNLPEVESSKNTNDYYNSNDFSSGTLDQASALPLPFLPQSTGPNSHLLQDT